jgi:hypothetical protein
MGSDYASSEGAHDDSDYGDEDSDYGDESYGTEHRDEESEFS